MNSQKVTQEKKTCPVYSTSKVQVVRERWKDSWPATAGLAMTSVEAGQEYLTLICSCSPLEVSTDRWLTVRVVI